MCSNRTDASATSWIVDNIPLNVPIVEEEVGEEVEEKKEKVNNEEEEEEDTNEQHIEVETIEVPILLCLNAGIKVFILTLYDDGSPFDDIHFIYMDIKNNNYQLLGYIHKVFH